MENEKIKTSLERKNDVCYLVFKFNEGEKRINLNSNDQNELTDLFEFILKKLFCGIFEFESPNDESKDLFYEVSVDYINALNNELVKTYEQIPEELKQK